MHTVKRLFFIAASLAALLAAAAESPFRWGTRFEGGVLAVELEVAPGSYLNADSVSIRIFARNGQHPALLAAPVQATHDDGMGGSEAVYPPGKYLWRYGGEPPFDVTVAFQGCLDDGTCLMPQTLRLLPDPSAEAELASGFDRADWGELPFALRGKLSGAVSEEKFLAFLRGGGARRPSAPASVWLMLALALLGGVLLNFTPCVLPMIPVNLMIIQAAGKGAWTGFRRGGCYALGMAAAYGMLGALAAAGGARFGELNSSSVFNFIIAGVFIVLALATAGVFNLEFNRWHVDPANLRLGAELGALIMGALAALLAGACVAPVVLTVLVFSAERFQAGHPAALLMPLALGIGMGAPWPFAGMGLAVLPKPGRFMVYVKYAFAVLILAMAAYYAKLGFELLPGKPDAGRYSPDREFSRLETALARSRREKRPVLIDFWATWCGNCRHMERTVLAAPEVKRELDKFIVVKFQAEDLTDPRTASLLERWELPGLPSFVILEPKP